MVWIQLGRVMLHKKPAWMIPATQNTKPELSAQEQKQYIYFAYAKYIISSTNKHRQWRSSIDKWIFVTMLCNHTDLNLKAILVIGIQSNALES